MCDATAGLGDVAGLSETNWLGYRRSRPQDRQDFRIGSVAEPPVSPPYGMTTDQLAEYQRRFTTYARLRIHGTGNREYNRGDKQAFEDMSVHRLIDEAVDELADFVNYAVMLSIGLQRLQRRVEDTL